MKSFNELNERHGSFLSEEVIDALIEQYKHELNNAQIYLAFSSWAHVQGFPGAKKWFRHQYEEEQKHAVQIFEFLSKSGIHFFISGLDVTQIELDSCKSLYIEALKLETQTTDSLKSIFKLCGDNQFIAQEFVNQLLQYQLEEEEEARTRYKIVMNTADPMVADHVIFDL